VACCGSRPSRENHCGIPRSQILRDLAPPSARRALSWKSPFHLLGRAAENFLEDRGTQLAGAISYFTLFALFPVTLLLVSVFGIVLRNESIQERVLIALIDYLPIDGSAIADSLRQVADLGATVTLVAFVGALWTAGALSAAIRQALNQVFEVETRRPMLRAKLVDFVLLPVLALPLIGGIVLTTMLQFLKAGIQNRWGLLDGRWVWTWDVGAFLIPLSLSFLAFAALYRFAPNHEQPMRYIWPGALFAALAFEGLKAGFGLYLEHFGIYSLYGSLGSVVVLLFWVYLSANIMVFGAEIANEIPHVLRHDPHPGDDSQTDLKRSVWNFARGLLLVQDDTVRPRASRVRHGSPVGHTNHGESAASGAPDAPEDDREPAEVRPG